MEQLPANVIIKDILPYMNKKYWEKLLSYCGYALKSIEIRTRMSLPYDCVITLDSPIRAEQFVNQFDNNNLDGNTNQ